IRKISLPLWTAALMMVVSQTAGFFSRKASFLTLEKFQEMKQALWTCSNRSLEILNLDPLTDLKAGLAKTKNWYEKEGWF
ncbi:MAG TPA: hypothetical protein VI874_03445, partial [Candidatus Norongarragalinales archaeon]|nr:hypothetical protein [Candidatus Norongarragalinales archaeon]